jgi:hypothetical protein
MKINQISVFLENRAGRLGEVCSLLGGGGVNIRALTIAETEDFGVLRMVVDRPEKAVQILRDRQFVVKLTDVVAVEVEDRPGGLAAILKALTGSGLNVEYMYGFVEKASDRALMVFRFDSPERALEVLKRNDLTVLGPDSIVNL